MTQVEKVISVPLLYAPSDDSPGLAPGERSWVLTALSLQTRTIGHPQPKRLVQGVGVGVEFACWPLPVGRKGCGVGIVAMTVCKLSTVGWADGVTVGVGDAAISVKKAAG